ncbi:MAG: hypothetical protein L0H84_03970 [Pseudonocardia sp.]|nr:hypothetical protein [Pseudonocardia sp.]
MGRLCTPEPYVDPVVTVIGEHGTPYPCPDLAALDGHLVELTRRIRLAGLRFPNLVADLRSDIDRLLERRRWLEVAALDGARVAA